jgi:multicomponent Na+:H+ antiporter subunit F
MTLYDFINYFVLPVLSLSAILILYRFLKGPSIVDRVIALDLIITTGIGFIGAYSILYNKPSFLDVAMILALIAFLGTVAFSYYIQKRNRNK